ASCICLP
ncbi:hypothetical protein CP061683_0148B, partial [Chlamydia psittaci 06-1683]